MRSRRTPFAVLHLWLAGAFLRDPEILARDSGTGCVLRWRGLEMSFHARQLIPALGKDQYFEVIREWDILCCDLQAIESGGSVRLAPRIVQKFGWHLSKIFPLCAQPAHHETQILSCLWPRSSRRCPFADCF